MPPKVSTRPIQSDSDHHQAIGLRNPNLPLRSMKCGLRVAPTPARAAASGTKCRRHPWIAIKGPEAGPFLCNLDLLIMLGGLLLGLPGLLALMPEGVAGLPIRREFELGRQLTGCTRRDNCLRRVHGQRHTFVLG